jgi:tetratricopeptide (TPR) repeat protein
VYDALSKEVGVDATVLQQKLPDVAINLQRAPDATAYEKANAAYVANDYIEAERLALQAVDDFQKAGSAKPAEIVQAYELAGFAAQKRIQFKTALEHFRAAEKLTDRQAGATQWADVQHAIGDLLMEQGSYREAEEVLRAAADVREHALGADHADTLRSRIRLAYAQYRQGKYNDAIAGFRAVVALEERLFGPMHPDTLLARNGLAIALDNGGNRLRPKPSIARSSPSARKCLVPNIPTPLGPGITLPSPSIARAGMPKLPVSINR